MKLSKETQQAIKMYQANDWEIDHETPEYVMMKKKQKQSVGVHVALLLFTCGIGNIIYYLVKMKPETKKVMK
jgi:hypothetical protein